MSLGKITEGKLNYELDWSLLTLLAERMQKGKEKYKPYSWKKPTSIEDLKQALFRHTLEIMKGNYLDDGQQYGHIGGCLANLMMIHYQLTSTEKEPNIDTLKEIINISKEVSNDMLFGHSVRELIK